MTASSPDKSDRSDAPPVLSRVRSWVRREPLVPTSKRSRLAATVVLALLAVGAGTAGTVERVTALPPDAAYRVHGEVVTVAQLDERVRLLGALYGVQAPADPAELDRFRRETAKAVAVADILDLAAADAGVVIAEKAANDELTRVLQTGYPDGRADFVAQLGQLGLSEAAVLDEVTRQLANAQLFDQVTGDVALPTDDEVTAAYEARRSEMVTPESRGLRNIVVASREAADAVRVQLDGGADFAALAATSSLDVSTKDAGGELGVVSRDQLEQAYGDAAFTAVAGGVFGPVQTRSGWNVGQVQEVIPAEPLSLDQVRDPLRSSLAEERRTAVWDEWLTAQLADADVDYAAAYRPADPLSPAGPTP